jgi:hypothetical protein
MQLKTFALSLCGTASSPQPTPILPYAPTPEPPPYPCSLRLCSSSSSPSCFACLPYPPLTPQVSFPHPTNTSTKTHLDSVPPPPPSSYHPSRSPRSPVRISHSPPIVPLAPFPARRLQRRRLLCVVLGRVLVLVGVGNGVGDVPWSWPEWGFVTVWMDSYLVVWMWLDSIALDGWEGRTGLILHLVLCPWWEKTCCRVGLRL